MKKQLMNFTRWAASMLAMAVLSVGCASDNANFYTSDNVINPDDIIDANSVGYLSLSGLPLEVSLESEVASSSNALSTATRADDESLNDYIVSIFNSKNEVSYQDSYLNTTSSTQTLELPADYYTVVVTSHDEIPVTGDYPCYASAGGSTDTYAVGDEKEVVAENTVTCKLANLKVSATISADLLSKFKPVDLIDYKKGDVDLTATMSYGTASIDFVNNNTKTEIGSKINYFAKNTETTEMTILLTGMYNTAAADEEPSYKQISWSESVSDVDSGQAREISIKIDNYSDGKLLCNFDVESWIEDSPLGVDVQSIAMMMYTIGEDVITDPDKETTDAFSPETIVTIGGSAYDLTTPYEFVSSMLDEDLLAYTNPIIAYVSPYGTTSVSSVALRISSDNETLMSDLAAMTNSDGDLPLWSDGAANSALSQYMTIRNDSGTIKVTMLYAGMVAFEQYRGLHTIKFVATGSNNMKSYTTFMCEVISDSGPTIEWQRGTNGMIYDFETRYHVYTDDDATAGVGVNPEVVINISSETGITALTVAISGEILTEAELALLDLTPVMDLINPATPAMATTLSGLGFPIGAEISGATTVSFDISEFMPMLALLASPSFSAGDIINTEFTITVADELGTSEQMIMVCHTQP